MINKGMKAREIISVIQEGGRYDPHPVPGTSVYIHPPDNNPRMTQWAENNLDTLREFVRENCGPWLSQSQGRPAYRGVSRRVAFPAFVKPVREDRRPRDSGPGEDEWYEFLLRTAGSQATRRNALFATGRWQYAEEYGRVYGVLPMGQFSYTWLPGVSDWGSLTNADSPTVKWIDPERLANSRAFGRFVDQIHAYSESLQNVLDDQGPLALAGELIRRTGGSHWGIDTTDTSIYDPQLIRQGIRVDEGLPEALHRGAELMIRCDQALYIHMRLEEHLL